MPTRFRPPRRPTIRPLRSILWLTLGLLLALPLAAPDAASADPLYSCFANCRDCSGHAWFDCFTIACGAVGNQVACGNGCCLWWEWGFCWAMNGTGIDSIVLECGEFLDPGSWLQDGPATPGRTCLELGVEPVARPDHRPNWVLFDVRDAEGARIVGSSPGFQRALAQGAPAGLDARAEVLKDELIERSEVAADRAFLIAIVPSEVAQPATLEAEHLVRRDVVAASTGAGTFEIGFDREGRVVEVDSVYWSDRGLSEELAPILRDGLRATASSLGRDDAPTLGRKRLAPISHFAGVVHVAVEEGAISSIVSYVVALP
ncbi:MAG: hypothetical protein AAGC60_09770 [Acidobacteriota bacterium]